MSAIGSVSWQKVIPLARGWELLRAAPGEALTPDQVDQLPSSRWLAAQVPGTVASALRQQGGEVSSSPDFDEEDAWYRLHFEAGPVDGGPAFLRLGGLATLAEVWLNGELVIESTSMWRGHRVEVQLGACNVLHLRFAALGRALGQRRPRPRWKTRLVAQQQLRWWRTTLLGRIPSWTPPVAPVGPYRPISLERPREVDVLDATVRPSLSGRRGTVSVSIETRPLGGHRLPAPWLRLGGEKTALEVRSRSDGTQLWEAQATLADVERWWPHTHGTPALHRLEVEVAGLGTMVLPPVGFRTLEAETADGGFTLRVNGERIFCRGACWTSLDAVSLDSSADGYRRALEQFRDAGMNMIRVGGTMVYEADAFHDLCDELGILVWQDFMFANLDYPADDPEFQRAVAEEADTVVARIGGRPSTAVFCGNSEVEQQVAMLGLPREFWRSTLFSELLPARVEAGSAIPYVPSSPSGGVLPFQVSEGVSHYYGVGAYFRPLEDARRADVRFTAECLAFSNVPDTRTIDALLGDGQTAPHHPRWKERVPRDRGPGWDFEDVRDHYLQRLFKVDPLGLRYADPQRYLALGRVVTAEVMEATFAEWRRHGSRCAGGLVWFLRDLWPGAGWGIVDSLGRPKAAYWALRRVLGTRATILTDEGNNGLALHFVNDGPSAVQGRARVTLYRNGTSPVASGESDVTVPARGTLQLWVEGLLERFVDAGYAFRFGPPGHDLVVARWSDAVGRPLSPPAFHFPLGRPSRIEPGLTLDVTSVPEAGGRCRLRLAAPSFAQSVSLSVEGFEPDDDFFHLEPGIPHEVRLTPSGGKTSPEGTASPLNAPAPFRFRVTS